MPERDLKFRLSDEGELYREDDHHPVSLDNVYFYLMVIDQLREQSALDDQTEQTPLIDTILQQLRVREFRYGQPNAESLVLFLIDCAESQPAALRKLQQKLQDTCEQSALRADFPQYIDASAFSVQSQHVEKVVARLRELSGSLQLKQFSQLLREIAKHFDKSTNYQVEWPKKILLADIINEYIFWENFGPTLFLESKSGLMRIAEYLHEYTPNTTATLVEPINADYHHSSPRPKVIPFPNRK